MAYKNSTLIGVAALIIVAGAVYYRFGRNATDSAIASSPPEAPVSTSVELPESLAASVKIQRVEEHEFPVEKQAIGSIDFNAEMTVQVFAPYQGRIIELFARVGDDVKKGQTLFTIDSPDLVQAGSTLISTAGVLELTHSNLARLRNLVKIKAAAQKDLDQAISDQQAGEGAHRAARDAVRLFGKTEAEIDRMVAERRVASSLVVPCPITGRITARNAAPGLFLQPGNPPPPFAVADISTMWMLANVHESESPHFMVGQEVRARVMAYADRVFDGKITTIGESVDPSTHRVLVRSEITDPKHELRPGMFATFVIRVGDPIHAVAIPADGIVREGDGSMVVWVTTDQRRFSKRTVTTGMRHEGYVQIVEGLQSGELVAGEGALFISNTLAGTSRS
jgi:cobalt-zinc-cadmium efflux system membrane fusion protein